MKSIQPGRYRHYKGNEYEVVGLVRHSETEEDLVLYRAVYEMNGNRAENGEPVPGQTDLWVRPLLMFQEMVSVAGTRIPRFKYLSSMD